jgi:hypothetical protein
MGFLTLYSMTIDPCTGMIVAMACGSFELALPCHCITQIHSTFVSFPGDFVGLDVLSVVLFTRLIACVFSLQWKRIGEINERALYLSFSWAMPGAK